MPQERRRSWGRINREDAKLVLGSDLRQPFREIRGLGIRLYEFLHIESSKEAERVRSPRDLKGYLNPHQDALKEN